MFKKILISLLFVGILLFLWFGNLKVISASRALAKEELDKAFQMGTFVNYELVKYMANKARETEDVELAKETLIKLNKVLKERPNNIKLTIHATYMYYLIGDTDSAEEMAERSVQLSPNREDVRLLLRQTREI